MTKEQEINNRITELNRELLELNRLRASSGWYLSYGSGAFYTSLNADWYSVWAHAGTLIREYDKVKILDGAHNTVCILLHGQELREYMEGE